MRKPSQLIQYHHPLQILGNIRIVSTKPITWRQPQAPARRVTFVSRLVLYSHPHWPRLAPRAWARAGEPQSPVPVYLTASGLSSLTGHKSHQIACD
ncbi:hypothetical protein RRG08_003701 [Elysia crispata]|uniref:Uncharacterized protein n=1 Tax=Elysia crispata TaxID=231223 RepID=A0AAE1E538_9GAST|nr:hypothetical protein RRG08_003701 [Elysia crispata]